MVTPDYTHGTFTIVDNTNSIDYRYEDYKEYCEDNNVEPQSEDSYDFFNWQSEVTQENFESDMDNIKCCKEYNQPVIITGERGLWDGTHTIYPVECSSVYEALYKCFDSCELVKAQWSDGIIKVFCSHHDGTNYFEIKPKNADRLSYLYA